MNSIQKNYVLKCNFNLYYFDDIIAYLNSHEEEILSFFKINQLAKPCTIEIMNWDDFSEYQMQIKGYIRDYMRGNTDINNHSIKVLLLEDQVIHTTHKDATLEDTLKTILHEFIHICHASVQEYRHDLKWFFEGIATNLAKNNYEICDLYDCDFSRLKDDFNNYGKGRYRYAYTIVNFILNNYSKEEIDKLIHDVDYLEEKSGLIFESAKKSIRIN